MKNRILKLIMFPILGTALHLSAAQQTPNIDKLAKEGMRFTDANTPASICGPTRYAFLTGRYAWRGVMKHSVLSPPGRALHGRGGGRIAGSAASAGWRDMRM